MAAALLTRAVGSQGLRLPAITLGTMGLSWAYKPLPADEVFPKSEALFDAAIAAGCNAFVTGWIYGFVPGLPHNEEVLGKMIAKHGRDKVIIIDKIGVDIRKSPPHLQSPTDLRTQLEESLARLGTPYLDVLVLNRPSPSIDIRETMAVFKAFVAEGKAKYIGLSEASAAEIRAAHAVHPISLIEQEYSCQTRDVERDILPTTRELGIGVLAYSPLGRGLLAGSISSRTDLGASDYRAHSPRFSEANFAANAAAAASLKVIADAKGVTPAQLSLAWLLAKGTDIVPIPGTTSPARLLENITAASIALTPAEVDAISAAVEEGKGDRYAGMHGTYNSKAGGAAH